MDKFFCCFWGSRQVRHAVVYNRKYNTDSLPITRSKPNFETEKFTLCPRSHCQYLSIWICSIISETLLMLSWEAVVELCLGSEVWTCWYLRMATFRSNNVNWTSVSSIISDPYCLMLQCSLSQENPFITWLRQWWSASPAVKLLFFLFYIF